ENPAAVIPMRLTSGALDSLVVLSEDAPGPIVAPARPQATFVVDTTVDGVPGSLRQAILDANTMPGADMIIFSIGSGGFQEILLASSLPIVDETVTIDATTQP